ncbi:MAG TPA: squalene synthase HpnC [Candidatus Kapabacteria bacterium]|nr:squalene synthase HpnC [Candidatus Kapabacteria bacterium]
MNIYQGYDIEQLSELYINGKSNIDINESYRYVANIANSHYENFPIASFLIPKELRKYIFAIYAFSRLADDIADEDFVEHELKLNILDKLNHSIQNILNKEQINNPILQSLQDTILRFNLPIDLFSNLISAFKSDVDFHQADNWEETLDYCKKSADPVGELILRIFNEQSEQNLLLSHYICSGLQLINFWQDLSRDLQQGRCYIPKHILRKHNIAYQNLGLVGKSSQINGMLGEIYDYTEELFEQGSLLPKNIQNKMLSKELSVIIDSGGLTLRKIRKLENNILQIRPKIIKFELIVIIIRAFLK